MEYNLKIVDYENELQVNYYEKKIVRGDRQNEDNKKDNSDSKQPAANDIQATWHNPTTGKVEVIPYGYRVIEHPIYHHDMLFPIERFCGPDVYIDLDFEKMKIYVDEKIREENEAIKFKNEMHSLTRTRQTIYNLARANQWELFVTFTFNDESLRNDLDSAKKRISKKLNNVKVKNGLDFKYLLIPEQDNNGNWHFHGLMKNIKGLKLSRAINPHTGNYIKQNGKQVYNLEQFNDMGHNTATYVQDNSKVVRYILKYITKEMELKFPGKRKYLSSKGLEKGREVVFDIEDEKDIPDKLREVYGYDVTMTYGRTCHNYYNDSEVKYMQFKK